MKGSSPKNRKGGTSENPSHKRQSRAVALAKGRSHVQTRSIDDKRPGKPRFMSSQREMFCRLIAFRGYHPTEAYREAYESEGKDETVRVEGSKLRNDPEIAQRIENLLKPIIDAGVVTLEGHLRTLAELRDDARQNGEFSPAIQAESIRGKVAGLHVERNLTASTLEELVAGSMAQKHEKAPVVSRGSRKRKAK